MEFSIKCGRPTWMTFACVAALVAGAGCTSKTVRVECDGRLQPINAPAVVSGTGVVEQAANSARTSNGGGQK